MIWGKRTASSLAAGKLGLPQWIGAVLAFLGIGEFFFLPWLDRSPVKSIRYRPTLHWWFYTVFVIAFLILGYLGTLPPTDGRTLVAQICMLIYFAFFLLMPWWSRWGQFKPVPARVTM